MTTEKLIERFEMNIHFLQKKSNHNYRIEFLTLKFHIVTCVSGESLLVTWQLTPSASERRRKRHCCFDFCVRKKNLQTFVNKKFFDKSTKMYAVLRRNLRDLRIIASQVQRLQARNPQTTQTLVRTYMQGKGSRAEINNIWIQVQSFTYVFTYYIPK